MWLKQASQSPEVDAVQRLNALHSDGVNLQIDELIRYQNKSSLIQLPKSNKLHSQMSGNYLARSKGRGMEFDEVRHYQNGDDIRAIDWRVTARTGETHTKLFREELERPVIIATDLSTNMLFGSQLLFKSVQAAHLAALIAWHAKQRGDRLGGIVFNESNHTELKPRSRQQGVLHYLHALVTCHQDSQQLAKQQTISTEQKAHFFEQNCLRVRQVARPGSLVYFITDGHHIDDEAIRHLSNISRHCELITCLISDPLEQKLPQVQGRLNVQVTDGQTQQQLTLGDEKIASRYQQKAHDFIEQKEALFSKAGSRLLHFCASETLEEQIKNGGSTWIR